MNILLRMIPVKIRYLLRGMRPEVRRQRRLTLEHYSLFIRPGDLVFDIGANIGDRTMVFRRLGARVIAVEPQERCVNYLRSLFSGDNDVIVVAEALSESEGEGDLAINDGISAIATMSRKWKEDGRFSQYSGWARTQRVRTTTLDSLLARFGTPVFCKIDVEGYELNVLKGLSSPLHVVSIEFAIEFISDAVACVDHLSRLGHLEANYSVGESMHLSLEQWVDPSVLFHSITSQNDPSLWGDIYVRFVHPAS